MKVDLEVLDAFIDGEEVDVLDVKDALATPDGRDYIVDAWMLRQAVNAESPVAKTAKTTNVPTSRTAGRNWLVAAGIAASLVGGFYAGRMAGTTPTPVQVQVQSPGPVITPAAASGGFPVPAATRVIRLEFNNPVSGGD